MIAYVISGGQVTDGLGGPPVPGSVFVKDGVIVPSPADVSGFARLDASGFIVSPGFIDMHSNLTWGPLIDPACSVATGQGVTTALTGNCGGSLFPAVGPAAQWIDRICADHGACREWSDLAGYVAKVGPTGIDLLPMAGHAMLRSAVAARGKDPLDGEQRASELRLAEQALTGGAWGISFGLTYPPGAYADRRELLDICSAVAHRRRVACFHIRIESDRLEAAVEEVCSLALDSGVTAVICHHKALGRANWGKSERTLGMIEEARGRGADVLVDMYPYTTAVRNLAMMLPDWAHVGGRRELVRRLNDDGERRSLARSMLENARAWDADWSTTTVVDAPATPELQGRVVQEILSEIGAEGLLDALARNDGRIITFYEGASWDDLGRVASWPHAMVGSDGDAQVPGTGHPRSFGTFPAFIDQTVRSRELLTLGEAVRRMTSLPAEVLGLQDRGVIRPGLRADLCVFDPGHTEGWTDKVSGRSQGLTFPRHLLVGGEPVIIDHHRTPALPGGVRLLTR